MQKEILELTKKFKKFYDGQIDCAIVLGSGLNAFADILTDKKEIAYNEFKELPKTTAKGHLGKFVVGKINKKTVLALQGRFHMYEGNSPYNATKYILMLKQLGVKTLILSNASGAINSNYNVGDLMIINDQINFTRRTPLEGKELQDEQVRFISMLEPYNTKYIKLLNKIAQQKSINVQNGTYIQVFGPEYETKAEIAMYKKFGDAVGMSTAIETIMSNYCGIDVVGISCITNKTGKDAKKMTHEEVLENASKVMKNFTVLAKTFIEKL